jgi:hypothetical protein
MGSGRRKADPVDQVFVLRKREAVGLGQGCVDALLKNYVEPSRKGTAKGDPIGLSRQKLETAILAAILYPLLPLKEIGKIVGVSETQLRVWRVQPAFQDAEKWAGEEIGVRFRNTIQRSVEKIEDPEVLKPYVEMTGIAGIDSHPHLVLLKLLPFFADSVLLPTSNLLDEKNKAGKEDSRYAGLSMILAKAIYLRQDRNLERWIKSPLRVANIKSQIASVFTITIGLLLYPDKHAEILPDGVDRKDFAEGIGQLQDFIFEGIDLLAR